MLIPLLIWALIVSSALIAFGMGAHALLGGPLREMLGERSRSVLLFLSSMSLLAVPFLEQIGLLEFSLSRVGQQEE